MRRAVIIGGAKIGAYETVRSDFCADDFFIFCDSGLYHREQLGVRADLIIGDFDSHPIPEGTQEPVWSEPAPYGQVICHTQTADGTELIILPHMKDQTDTVYAAEEAVRRGFQEALLIGASGGRPDLYFSNIAILDLLDRQGVSGRMIDELSEIRLLSAGRTASVPDDCRFFSLLAYDGPARGVHVRNALYPLSDALITASDPYAVSNEVLPGKTAEVTLGEGKLLLVIIRG